MTTKRDKPRQRTIGEELAILEAREKFNEELRTDDAGNRSLFFEEQPIVRGKKKARRGEWIGPVNQRPGFTPRAPTTTEQRQSEGLERPKRPYDDDY